MLLEFISFSAVLGVRVLGAGVVSECHGYIHRRRDGSRRRAKRGGRKGGVAGWSRSDSETSAY